MFKNAHGLKTFTSKLDMKKLSDDGSFEGYGSVFHNEDRGGDVVAPGAFATTLNGRKLTEIKMLWQHDPSSPIGVWEEMKEDHYGLWVKGRILSAVSKGAEALALMRAGVIDGLSIGFRTVKSSLDHETYVRTLTELELWEVSVVTFPMNPAATVEKVKNVTARDVEKLLRDAGYSANYAKMVANHGATKANSLLQEQRDVAAKKDEDFVNSLFQF